MPGIPKTNIDKTGCLTLALLGLAQVGKTSLANSFLGQNDEMDEEYNKSLDLFAPDANNETDYKYGNLLGK